MSDGTHIATITAGNRFATRSNGSCANITDVLNSSFDGENLTFTQDTGSSTKLQPFVIFGANTYYLSNLTSIHPNIKYSTKIENKLSNWKWASNYTINLTSFNNSLTIGFKKVSVNPNVTIDWSDLTGQNVIVRENSTHVLLNNFTTLKLNGFLDPTTTITGNTSGVIFINRTGTATNTCELTSAGAWTTEGTTERNQVSAIDNIPKSTGGLSSYPCYMINVTLPSNAGVQWIYMTAVVQVNSNSINCRMNIQNYSSGSRSTLDSSGTCGCGASCPTGTNNYKTFNFNATDVNMLAYNDSNRVLSLSWQEYENGNLAHWTDYLGIQISYTSPNANPDTPDTFVFNRTNSSAYSTPNAINVSFRAGDSDLLSDISQVWLEHNFTGTLANSSNITTLATLNTTNANYTFTTGTPSAGTYVMRAIINDSTNAVTASANVFYEITTATPTVTIGTVANVTYPTTITAFCTATNTDGQNCNLFRNTTSTIVQNVTTAENNTAIRLGVADWNYTTNVSSSQNYSANSNISYVTIAIGTPTVSTIGATNVTYPTTSTLACTSTNDDLGARCSVFLNLTTAVPANWTANNDTAVGLNVGWFNVTSNSTATQNYSAVVAGNSSMVINFQISQATPTTSVSFSGGSSNVTYPTSITPFCFTSNGDSTARCSLFFNMTTTVPANQTGFNNTAVVLNSGWFNFTANNTATQNYSATNSPNSSMIINVQISQATPTVSTIGAVNVTYPTSSTLSCISNNGDSDARCSVFLNLTTGTPANWTANNNTAIRLNSGWFNATSNQTSTQNYTAVNSGNSSMLINFQISQATPTVNAYGNFNTTYPTQSTWYCSSSNDDTGARCSLFFNMTTAVPANQTTLNNTAVRLNSGWFNVTSNSTSTQNYSATNSPNSSMLIYSQQSQATPAVNIYGAYNITYGTSTTIFCSNSNDDSTSACSTFLNLTTAVPANITNNTAITLNTGWFNTTANATSTQNYTSVNSPNSSMIVNFQVLRGNVSIDLYLNGTQNGNNSIVYSSDMNITARINISSQNAFTLHENGTSRATQSGQNIEYNNDTAVRDYNFTAFYDQTQNYSAYSTAYYLQVLRGNITTSVIGALNVTYPTASTLGCIDNSTDSARCSLFLNLTTVVPANFTTSNNTAVRLNVGWFNVTANNTQTENFTATNSPNSSMVINYQITQATGTVTLGNVLNTTYPTSTTAFCGANNDDANIRCSIFRNTTSTTVVNVTSTENNTATALNAAWFNYTSNVSSSQNYTFGTNTSYIRILPANFTINLFLNGTMNNRFYSNNSAVNASAITNITTNTTPITLNIESNTTGWVNTTRQSTTYENLTRWNSTADTDYNFTVYISANSNYSSNSSNWHFRQDVTPPRWENRTNSNGDSVTYTGSGQTHQFNMSWVDAYSGVMNSILEFDGTNYTADNQTISGENRFRYTLTGLAAGTYSYKWYGNDSVNVNNWNTSDAFSYLVQGPGLGGGGGGGGSGQIAQSIAQLNGTNFTVEPPQIVIGASAGETKLATVLGTGISFTVKNIAPSKISLKIYPTGPYASWSSLYITNPNLASLNGQATFSDQVTIELLSGESKAVIVQIKVPENTSDGNYPIQINFQDVLSSQYATSDIIVSVGGFLGQISTIKNKLTEPVTIPGNYPIIIPAFRIVTLLAVGVSVPLILSKVKFFQKNRWYGKGVILASILLGSIILFA